MGENMGPLPMLMLIWQQHAGRNNRAQLTPKHGHDHKHEQDLRPPAHSLQPSAFPPSYLQPPVSSLRPLSPSYLQPPAYSLQPFLPP